MSSITALAPLSSFRLNSQRRLREIGIVPPDSMIEELRFNHRNEDEKLGENAVRISRGCAVRRAVSLGLTGPISNPSAAASPPSLSP